jgi:hypothetical protein
MPPGAKSVDVADPGEDVAGEIADAAKLGQVAPLALTVAVLPAREASAELVSASRPTPNRCVRASSARP